MTRPDDLPEYANPPLNEVVLGIQFDPPVGYQQIRAGEVWNLFKKDFPVVEELPALPPAFETFASVPTGAFNFNVNIGTSHDRFWFVSKQGEELVQFQNDRLLHNWRKVGDLVNTYPRFEAIIEKFESELELFEAYIQKLKPQRLTIRQCEVTYVNHLKTKDYSSPVPSDWLRFVASDVPPPDDFSASFRRTIAINGQPRGRLICETSTAVDHLGRPFIVLSLTARGAPGNTDTKSALEFLTQGRNMIVRLFSEITTDSAQRIWERTR